MVKLTWLFVCLVCGAAGEWEWEWEWARCQADMGKWVKFQAFSYI